MTQLSQCYLLEHKGKSTVHGNGEIAAESCVCLLRVLLGIADEKTVAKPTGKRPIWEQGYFEAEWVLPKGNYQSMQASFNNERLRILLPKTSA